MPTNMIRSAVLATFTLLLLASSAFAQTGSLRGRVIDKDGEGIPNAMIYIERESIRANYKVKTNKKGNYLHAGLPLGKYKVSLEIDGKSIYAVNGYPVSMGTPEPLDFDLGEIQRESQQIQASGPSKAQLGAMSNQQRKLYEKALKDRQQTISKNKKLNAAFNAGMEAKRLKDFATAVSYLKEATEIDPAQHVVWANLAELYSALFSTKVGDARKETEDLAIEAYHKALAIKPDPAYHNNLGLTLIRTGLIEEGSAELEIAAQLAPENAGTYYFNLGAVMVNSGNTERAIEAFRKATEVRPDYADAFYQLATALVGTAQMKDDGSIVPAAGTVEAYQKYLNLEPEGSYAPSAQAMVQSLTGKLETVFEQPKKRRK